MFPAVRVCGARCALAVCCTCVVFFSLSFQAAGVLTLVCCSEHSSQRGSCRRADVLTDVQNLTEAANRLNYCSENVIKFLSVFIYLSCITFIPVFEGRLATPGILPEHLNRGHITRFLSP